MVRVEFYGIPRARAGVAAVEIPRHQAGTLGELLDRLTEQFPALAQDCINDQKLTPYCKANFDGQQFVTDSRTSLAGVQNVLILSADAGG